MVAPLVLAGLTGLRAGATRVFPYVLPFAKKIVTKVGGFVVKKPLKTGLILTGAGFLMGSPTARETIIRSPTSLVKTGKIAGGKFEKSLQSELIAEPDSPITKALKIGGTAGLVTAGAILGKKYLEKKKKEKEDIPLATTGIPKTTGKAGIVPDLSSPQAEIISPTAVKTTKKQKRSPKPKQQPFFINQIQISNN
jgi:hypothetical protein